jgi:hypothetical protein
MQKIFIFRYFSDPVFATFIEIYERCQIDKTDTRFVTDITSAMPLPYSTESACGNKFGLLISLYAGFKLETYYIQGPSSTYKTADSYSALTIFGHRAVILNCVYRLEKVRATAIAICRMQLTMGI